MKINGIMNNEPAFKGAKEDGELVEAFNDYKTAIANCYNANTTSDDRLEESIDILGKKVDSFVKCSDPTTNSPQLAAHYAVSMKSQSAGLKLFKEMWPDYFAVVGPKIETIKLKLESFVSLGINNTKNQEEQASSGAFGEASYKDSVGGIKSGNEVELKDAELAVFNYTKTLFDKKLYFKMQDGVDYKKDYTPQMNYCLAEGFNDKAIVLIKNELVKARYRFVQKKDCVAQNVISLTNLMQKLGSAYKQKEMFKAAEDIYSSATKMALLLQNTPLIKEAIELQQDMYFEALKCAPDSQKADFGKNLERLLNIKSKYLTNSQ